MQVIHSREDFEQHLVVMHSRQGWSIRALARHFAVSRNTVRHVLRTHPARRDQGTIPALGSPPVRQGSKLSVHQELIKQLLEKYPRSPAKGFMKN